MTTPIYPRTSGIVHQIPAACTCSYTWGNYGGGMVRNGAMPNCPAHHPPPSHCAMCGELIQIHICQGGRHLTAIPGEG